MKKNLPLAACVALFAFALSHLLAASPADSLAARDERWANRSDAAQEAEVAGRFKRTLNLGSGLDFRVPLRPLAGLYDSSNGSSELACQVQGLFFAKLRNPKPNGLGVEALSPFGWGIADYRHVPGSAWDANKSPDAVNKIYK